MLRCAAPGSARILRSQDRIPKRASAAQRAALDRKAREKLGNGSNVWMSMVFVVDLFVCVYDFFYGCSGMFVDFY